VYHVSPRLIPGPCASPSWFHLVSYRGAEKNNKVSAEATEENGSEADAEDEEASSTKSSDEA
jgi:hypothetical protein